MSLSIIWIKFAAEAKCEYVEQIHEIVQDRNRSTLNRLSLKNMIFMLPVLKYINLTICRYKNLQEF